MSTIKILMILMISINLNAGDNPAKNKISQYIKTVERDVPKITPAKLRKWIKYEKDFILLDVRDSGELSSGFIDADDYLKISRGKLEFSAIKNNAVPIERTIVVYCKAGSRGALATKLFQDYGYKNIFNLIGGIDGWLEAGYPIETSLGTFRKIPDSQLD